MRAKHYLSIHNIHTRHGGGGGARDHLTLLSKHKARIGSFYYVIYMNWSRTVWEEEMLSLKKREMASPLDVRLSTQLRQGFVWEKLNYFHPKIFLDICANVSSLQKLYTTHFSHNYRLRSAHIKYVKKNTAYWSFYLRATVVLIVFFRHSICILCIIHMQLAHLDGSPVRSHCAGTARQNTTHHIWVYYDMCGNFCCSTLYI